MENFAYLINLGGKKLLHLGDMEYSAENFEGFDLTAEDIDVVFIPTFNTLSSAENRDVIMQQINPRYIVAMHLRAGEVESESAQVMELYPDATIFTTPLE